MRAWYVAIFFFLVTCPDFLHLVESWDAVLEKKELLKGDLKQESIPCAVDRNEIQNTPIAVFPFDLWSGVFRTDL